MISLLEYECDCDSVTDYVDACVRVWLTTRRNRNVKNKGGDFNVLQSEEFRLHRHSQGAGLSRLTPSPASQEGGGKEGIRT